jgi:2-polyprenyl-6-methoxyphenol hydroxylase-like FAD-dependent oxidoreductase
MNNPRHDVVIAGAGPVGLALAAELTRLGAPPLLLDKLPAGANTSRAAVIHARTLEVLDPLGVTPQLLENGIVVPTFRIRDRDRVLASISFKDLHTPYPFTLMCPQDRTEAVLLRRLRMLGGAVQRPYELVSCRPVRDEVELQCKSPESLHQLRAKWLVGCDGMQSTVREHASIPFEGGAYEENFLLADVEMAWPLDREEVSLFFSSEGLMVVAPLPGEHFRIVATVESDPDGARAPRTPSMADFQRILEQRGPRHTPAIRRMVWSSRFHVHHRIAKVLRKGQILLAGDAAHVHSPAGGQGMNTGIQDAISLAAALSEVLRNRDEAVLDAWQESRLEIARSVVALTDRITKVATASSPAVKLLRNAAIGIIGHIPYAQHAIAQQLAELDNR